MQLGELSTGLNTQLGVQVGEGLIEEEYFRLADDRAANSNTLSLATGEFLGFTIEQVFDTERVSRFLDTAIDIRLIEFTQFEAKCHVIVNGHMGIESITLENHCNIAVFRSYIVDDLVANQNFTIRDFFEACQTAQGGGFAAAGRTDQHQKLFVLDCKIEILHGDNVAKTFPNMIISYACHKKYSSVSERV